MVDPSLFIAPLLVAGIAGLTLTSTAFQRPRRLVGEYQRRLEDLVTQNVEAIRENEAIPEDIRRGLVLQLDQIKERVNGSPFLDYPMRIINIRRIDFFEFIVMLSFLLLEICIALIFKSTPEDTPVYTMLTFEQMNYLSYGYVFLIIGITLILLIFLTGLWDTSQLYRKTKRFIDDIGGLGFL